MSSRPQSDTLDTLTNKITSDYGVCMQSIRPPKAGDTKHNKWLHGGSINFVYFVLHIAEIQSYL